MRPYHLVAVLVLFHISIHAPLTGCDLIRSPPFLYKKYFNPRTPYGMRPGFQRTFKLANSISIHAPLTGCDFV